MKKLLFTILMLAVTTLCNATYYLGHVTANVNLRDYPSTEGGIVEILIKGAQIVYNDEYETDGFYRAVFLEKDLDGYIAMKYIQKDKELKVNDKGMLQVVGETEDMIPIIEITNDTKYNLSLRIGEKKYTFTPKEKREIVSEAGKFDLMASVPELKGCEPFISTEKIETNYRYTWRFFIKVVPVYQSGNRKIHIKNRRRR